MLPQRSQLIILNLVESTNDYAMQMIHESTAKHGMGVFALSQTSGKGRLERTWQSAPGKNLILSVLFSMHKMPVYRQFLFSMWVALTVSSFIHKKTGLHPKVKWPNDIFTGDKKTTGILIENVLHGTEWTWAVAGIGINVNQSDFGTETHATSMLNETGKTFDVLQWAEDLRASLVSGLGKNPFSDIPGLVDAYNQKLYKRGEMVKLQAGTRVFEATIREVDKSGKLITEDTMVREWGLDEVKIRIGN